ncbi:MAG: Lrp/AsnC family transcriptional regulator [Sphingomonas sp.]|jgi:Lrp/AsnC family leucine-responsive transcriptional regulator|uniref:Lrp/AsnC family transcriptional regulator n=1 Tax=Sphingomonas sp. TaxID=28214 RepID=UPI00356932B4
MTYAPSKSLRDPTDVEILRHLVEDPCLATTQLARKVGMSAPAVRERVQRLEDMGVIAGRQLMLDPRALGYTVMVFIRIRPNPGRLQAIADIAREMPNVVECHRITGEDCFIVKAYLHDLDELDGVIDRFLVHGHTTTSIAQSSPVPGRPLPLPAT